MALACSVLSGGHGPMSAVHAVFGSSGFSAAEAAASLLLASVCGAAAGSCLPGAAASGATGRGGSVSPRAAFAGSIGTAFEFAEGAPLPIHKAMPATPSNARTTA
jgi:hypothetical protein